MSKKSKIAITYYVFMFGAFFGIICAIFNLSRNLRILDAIIVTIAIILVLKNYRCPFCGKYSIKFSPFAKENPHCIKCGKTI